MACGCGRRSAPRTAAMRPSVGPRPVQGGLAAAPNPAQIRAIGLPQNMSLGETRKMDEQRQLLEKVRREAIRKRLNK